MFEPHFSLRENPFVAGHQSRFVYPSPEHQEALAHLRYGIENREPFVLITGEVGTGKTTALFEVLNEWKARAVVAVVTNSALSRNELLEEIALRLGFSVPGALSKPQILSHLERNLLALHAKGERAILLLDEAQNLDRDLLEEIRLLSNLEAQGEKLLQVFLLGQPELDAKLSQPELRQLRQRVAVHYRLNPLSAEDTERYIHHRVAVAGGYGPKILPHDTCAEVYALTHGIPREINQICSQSLLNAFVDDAPVVRPEHVRAAAREIEFESVLRGPAAAERPSRPAITRNDVAPTVESSPPPTPASPEPAIEQPSPASPSDAPRAVSPPPAPPPAPIVEASPIPPTASMPVVVKPLPPEHTEGLPIDDATEHAPVGPVVAATDEANWEAWVRSLMTSRPAPEEASALTMPSASEDVAETEPADIRAHTTPPPPSSVPDPVHVPEPLPQPARVPEPVIVPEPDPDRSPEPPPSPSRPEPDPSPTRARAWQPMKAQAQEPKAPASEPWIPRAREDLAPAAATSSVAKVTSGEGWRPPLWTPESGGRRPSYVRASRFEDDADEEPSPTASRTTRWVVAATILVAIAMATILFFRFGPPAHRDAPKPSASAAAPAVDEAAKPPAKPPAGSSPTGAQASEPTPTGDAAAAHPNAPAPRAPLAAGDDGPTIPGPVASVALRAARPSPPHPTDTRPAVAAGTWSLVVGTFLDESRAKDESQRLGTSTGMPTRVRTVSESGSVMYQVALGTFSDRAAAEKAAGDLVGKGLVSEARVVARRKVAQAPTAP